MNTRLTKHCLSLMISSLLLLPAVNSHAGETTLLSVKAGGGSYGQYRSSANPAISADGRFVAYVSSVRLRYNDIYVLDRSTGTNTHVSVNSAGEWGSSRKPFDYGSDTPAISADGRFVAFISDAANLVEGDTNSEDDIFVHDLSTGATTRVSVDSAGRQGNAAASASPAISPDGRFVAFSSAASTMGKGDTNGYSDVFVHDRSTGTTARVSVDSAGLQGNHDSFYPAISADGRFVAFSSLASNLVPGDTNDGWDVFVHDRSTGATTRVSVDSAGQQGNTDIGYPYPYPSISADGRFVAFSSSYALAPGDTNGIYDVFVQDRTTGITTLVSVDSAGQPGNHASYYPKISADGYFVVFYSEASNLVAGDTNDDYDVFAHNRISGLTSRVSVNSSGEQGSSDSYSPAISADGHLVAFVSGASNLGVNNTSQNQITAKPLIFLRDRWLNASKTADLQLAVTSQPASVQKGQAASYTYTLINNGPDSIDKGTKLIDVIANGDLVSLTPSQGSCIKAAVSVCRFGALASGAGVTLTTVIKAKSDSLTQQISVNAPPVDDVPDNNSITVATPVTP